MDCEIVCVVGGDKGLQEIGLFLHLFWITKYRICLFSIDFEGTYGYKAFVRRRLVGFLRSASQWRGSRKGIIVVKGQGWSNARGHVTLWDGSFCSDACHLLRDPDNGLFVPETASLWVLH
jgi:hypothetical protein